MNRTRIALVETKCLPIGQARNVVDGRGFEPLYFLSVILEYASSKLTGKSLDQSLS